jgi:hypothetical protein
MNLNDLHKELIAAARSQLPGDRVPHTFEKRVMALLREPPALDYREWWARGLWRAALACLAFMLLLGALCLATPPRNSPSNDLSQDFENTMLASMNQDTDSTFSR